jgi:predicted acetyltransferase
MNHTIHHLSLEEAIPALRFLSGYAFTPTPPLPEVDSFAERIRQRKGAAYYAIMEDGNPQSIACSTTPLRQNLRGRLFPMGGIANVASHPAARRQGFVRSLMRHIYRQFKEDGIGLSCLYPFRESFYERLGYVTLPQVKIISFSPENIRRVLNRDLPGEVQLKTFQKGFNIYRRFLEAIQQEQHGMALFSIPEVEASDNRETWLAIARLEGKIVGLLEYTLGEKALQQHLEARNFLYCHPAGKFLLLDWIARHIDQTTTVSLSLAPGLFGETLFTDIRPDWAPLFVAPMGRVLDVERISGMLVGEGAIALELQDADCPWNARRWHFTGTEGTLTVQTCNHADCELSIQALSALIYGVMDPAEFALRGWGNPTPAQQATLRQMFPPAVPFLHAMY